MNAQRVIAAARAYVGTPFRHQGRVKGVGIDCAGLIANVARELDYSDYDLDGYSRMPDGETLRRVLDEHLDPVELDAIRPGDIGLFTIKKLPQHLAIFTDYGMIHAYQPVGRVVEHAYSERWQRRLAGVYRWRR